MDAGQHAAPRTPRHGHWRRTESRPHPALQTPVDEAASFVAQDDEAGSFVYGQYHPRRLHSPNRHSPHLGRAMRLSRILACCLILGSLGVLLLRADDPKKPGDPPSGPLSPREEMATFKLAMGFRVELAASEPEVIDPVSMCFDENGRLF